MYRVNFSGVNRYASFACQEEYEDLLREDFGIDDEEESDLTEMFDVTVENESGALCVKDTWSFFSGTPTSIRETIRYGGLPMNKSEMNAILNFFDTVAEDEEVSIAYSMGNYTAEREKSEPYKVLADYIPQMLAEMFDKNEEDIVILEIDKECRVKNPSLDDWMDELC